MSLVSLASRELIVEGSQMVWKGVDGDDGDDDDGRHRGEMLLE